MRFPPHILEEIRARIPVSEVVGQLVIWDRRKSQPSKGDFWACCPFHKEDTPSFHADDRKGIYKCFGCGATGDIFKFVTETDGLSFPQAVELLANDAGVDLPKQTQRAKEEEKEALDLIALVEKACAFFEAELRSASGQHARSYLTGKRGLTAETIKEFRLGFSPDSFDALKRHLKAAGATEEMMVEAGLIRRRDDGSTYDFFRGRVMIPIQDWKGRVIGFSARTLKEDGGPKYINTPDTPIFDKGATVFNLHRALEPARKSRTCLVVEGHLDAISVYQSGYLPVVACMGTAITDKHLARLWRLAPEPIICMDGDKAGLKAAYRVVDILLPGLKPDRSAVFAFLKDAKDPDELIRAGGHAALVKAIEKTTALADVLWIRETAEVRLDTPERRAALEKRLYDLTNTIADTGVRRAYRTAFRIRLSDLLWKAERRGGGKGSAQPVGLQSAALQAAASAAADILDKLLLGLLVEYPDLIDAFEEKIALIPFTNPSLGAFAAELLRLAGEGEFSPESVSEQFSPVLRDVHGVEGEGDDIRRGSMLRARLPILRLNPPPEFVQQVFRDLLEARAIKTAEAEVEAVIASTSDDEDAVSKTMAYITDLTARREALRHSQRVVDEQAVAMRVAAGIR